MSNNLNLSQVAAAQNQKEVTINDQVGELDAALTEVLAIEVDDTNAATLTNDQFRRNVFFSIEPDTTPPDGTVTITVPAIKRGLFVVLNETAQTAAVEVSGQSETAPTIDAGENLLLSCDGADVRAAGGGSGGSSTFLGLTDTPGSYSGQAGLVAVVNTGEDALEFVARTYDFGFSFAGGPPVADEVLGKVVIARDITLPADMAGAAGHVDVNPDAQLDIDVTDDGSSIGTITVSDAGALTFVTDGNNPQSIAAGSVIRFVAPNTPVGDVENIAATLQATVD